MKVHRSLTLEKLLYDVDVNLLSKYYCRYARAFCGDSIKKLWVVASNCLTEDEIDDRANSIVEPSNEWAKGVIDQLEWGAVNTAGTMDVNYYYFICKSSNNLRALIFLPAGNEGQLLELFSEKYLILM